MCEHIVNRMSDVVVANLATRQPSVSTAPGRGGSKPPASGEAAMGRQVGDPYKLRSFWQQPFNEPLYCGSVSHSMVVGFTHFLLPQSEKFP